MNGATPLIPHMPSWSHSDHFTIHSPKIIKSRGQVVVRELWNVRACETIKIYGKFVSENVKSEDLVAAGRVI